ncbi:MAG: N-6 DNA methylase [Thermoleophilaceae bacterium]
MRESTCGLSPGRSCDHADESCKPPADTAAVRTARAGSAESEIRRWIIENDWLEGIIALPAEQLFYNTGIAVVRVGANRKSEEREGKVQPIDARDRWVKMRKSLGEKRRELLPRHVGGVEYDRPAAKLSEAEREALPGALATLEGPRWKDGAACRAALKDAVSDDGRRALP